jgi:TatD DNase family protein
LKGAYQGVILFIKESVKVIPDVKATVVQIPGVNIKKCEVLTKDLGIELRVRKFDVVG